MIVWRMCCPAHTGNKGVGGVIQYVAFMNVCAVWPCGCCVLNMGWVVGFRSAVET